MVVVSKPKIQGGAIQVNIECARNIFAKNRNNELDELLIFDDKKWSWIQVNSSLFFKEVYCNDEISIF